MSDIITPDSFWRLGEIDIRLRLPIRTMQRLKKDAELRGVTIAEEAAYRIGRSCEDDGINAKAREGLGSGGSETSLRTESRWAKASSESAENEDK